MSQMTKINEAYWHDHNPWKDSLIYVPIDELAEASMLIGSNVRMPDQSIKLFTKADVLAHWGQYGNQLDPYVLTGKTITGGIRYGAEGHQYLSPGFSTVKLIGLIRKYKE
jgi:hypothetical protein